jgi:hypothetical protein
VHSIKSLFTAAIELGRLEVVIGAEASAHRLLASTDCIVTYDRLLIQCNDMYRAIAAETGEIAEPISEGKSIRFARASIEEKLASLPMSRADEAA